MQSVSRRGLLADDDTAFSAAMCGKLGDAQHELQFLLDRGYPMQSALAFVGGHHQFSSRQRAALSRTTAATRVLARREAKRLDAPALAGRPIYLDGFNLIITLEVALSDGMLFVAQDGCIRDLAELRGSYRLIPCTETAVSLLREALQALKVSEVVVFLDAPVSNSGRLKTLIRRQDWPMPLRVDLEPDPDAVLKTLSPVAGSDSVILDACAGWFNLVPWILESRGMVERLSRLVRLGDPPVSGQAPT